MPRLPAKVFTDVIVWQKAHKFVLSVYRAIKMFPSSEKYGLTSQLRRAAVSIPANITEGFKRLSRQEKSRFVNIAQGSLEECRYYLTLAGDLEYMESYAFSQDLDEVSRLLNAYGKDLASNGKSTDSFNSP